MTTQAHHVNASDAIFMQDMIALLRHGVRDGLVVGELASSHGGDPEVRSLAQDSSATSTRQIAALVSCVAEWNAEARPGFSRRTRVEIAAGATAAPAPASTTYREDLTGLHGRGFDARVTRNLLEYHRAVIALSRREMIEGLNPESRAFARDAISRHSGDLHRLRACA